MRTAPTSQKWTAWSCAVDVTVTDPAALTAAAALVRTLMDEVDGAVSRFRTDSDLQRVNRGGGRLVPVRSLTAELVAVALDAAATTGGVVHPALGTVLEKLGYDRDIEQVRTSRCSDDDLPCAGDIPPWSGIRLDADLRLVSVPAGAALDLGATAKAWTVDEAAHRIHQRFGCAALVGIGGDVASAGTPAQSWRIDVAERRGGPAVRVDLAFGGLATSSTQGRTWQSQRREHRHHLVDPRTGRPAEARWRTATVWAPSALEANIASTWLLVEPDAAAAWIEASGFAARMIDHDGVAARRGAWPMEEREAS